MLWKQRRGKDTHWPDHLPLCIIPTIIDWVDKRGQSNQGHHISNRV